MGIEELSDELDWPCYLVLDQETNKDNIRVCCGKYITRPSRCPYYPYWITISCIEHDADVIDSLFREIITNWEAYRVPIPQLPMEEDTRVDPQFRNMLQNQLNKKWKDVFNPPPEALEAVKKRIGTMQEERRRELIRIQSEKRALESEQRLKRQAKARRDGKISRHSFLIAAVTWGVAMLAGQHFLTSIVIGYIAFIIYYNYRYRNDRFTD